MKCRKTPGYMNYGPVPRNEYTITNTETNTNTVVALGYEPLADGKELEERSRKLRLHYRFGRSRSSGWLRSRSTNGWRAESAAQQDEAGVYK